MKPTYVYIYDEDDHEIEVDVELLEDGYSLGLYLSGPRVGEEITLTDKMLQHTKSKLLEMYEEYEAAKADYYEHPYD